MSKIDPNAILRFIAADKDLEYGYIGHSIRQPKSWLHDSNQSPYTVVGELDATLIDTANRLGLTEEELIEFCISRAGRHAGDLISGQKLDEAWRYLCAALIDYAEEHFSEESPDLACGKCGDSAEGGDGYDGLCGNCADKKAVADGE